MFLSATTALLRVALRILVPLCVLLTTYLYLYPAFSGCAFPLQDADAPPYGGVTPDAAKAAFLETVRQHLRLAGSSDAPLPTRLAPFRLLALGDPQLEGDSSIPNAHSESSYPHLLLALRHASFQSTGLSLRERTRQMLHDLVDFWFEDIPNTAESVRKRIDHVGNDLYLSHIYRSLRWWAGPTHVAVLGDLLGSQWIDDAEFESRAHRYWHRVMRGGQRVPDDVARYPEDEYDLAGYLGGSTALYENGTDPWRTRVINVAGNHDIGYAGDINVARLSRFERAFGKANYELRFEIPVGSLSPAAAASVLDEQTNPGSDRLVPELRIVNVNDMNLDTPALDTGIQDQTYAFINAVINTASAVQYKGTFTVVLTHVPLHKAAGTCVDAPYFSFHDDDIGGLREQNLLSADASRGFLEGIFGMHASPDAPGRGQGRPGVILNGHDHEGCDTYHYINQTVDGAQWEARPWRDASGLVVGSSTPGVREITVRSMMGDYGGNAGLLSAWFDEARWEWQFQYTTCPLGRQHLWWLVHILDLIAVVGALLYGSLCLVDAALPAPTGPEAPATHTKTATAESKKPGKVVS